MLSDLMLIKLRLIYTRVELLYSNGMCQEILLISDQLKLGFSGMVVALFKRKQFQLLYAVLRYDLLRRVVKKYIKRRLQQ